MRGFKFYKPLKIKGSNKKCQPSMVQLFSLWLVAEHDGLAKQFKSVDTMDQKYIYLKPSPHLWYTQCFSKLVNVEYVNGKDTKLSDISTNQMKCSVLINGYLVSHI